MKERNQTHVMFLLFIDQIDLRKHTCSTLDSLMTCTSFQYEITMFYIDCEWTINEPTLIVFFNFDFFLRVSDLRFQMLIYANPIIPHSISVTYNGTQDQVFAHSSEVEDEDGHQGHLLQECPLRGKKCIQQGRPDHADQTKESPQLGSGGAKSHHRQFQKIHIQTDGSTPCEERSRR